MSCQYPLASVYDLTKFNEMNKQNNSWSFIKTVETECKTCENRRLDNGTLLPRVYEAELWARVNETIRFHIKFSKGSHMNFTWMLDEDLGVEFDHIRQVNINLKNLPHIYLFIGR